MCACMCMPFTFTTRHIHTWDLLPLWLSLFMPFGAIPLLLSSTILGTFWPGEFVSQYLTFLAFHTIHGVLKVRMLNWFCHSTGLPVDHVLSELSTTTHSSWMALYCMAYSFIHLDKVVIHVISYLVFCDCGFHSVCPLMDEGKRLVEASWW